MAARQDSNCDDTLKAKWVQPEGVLTWHSFFLSRFF